MVSSVLICLDTLLELALEPGWNGNYEDFDRRREDIKRLHTLIEADQLMVYVPPFLVCIIHMQVKIHFGVEQAQRVVRKILELGNSHLSIDYDRLLEQSNTASHYPGYADLYDVMFLVCGNQLNVDAIATSNPGFFQQLIEVNQSTFAGFNVPIVNIGALVNLVSEERDSYPLDEETIYVVTPHNNVIKLPSGATPVDFAYMIHTRLGDRCVRALVNGREVALNRRLRTGDVVEIVKDPDATPDPSWLEFVVTRTAKRAIQRGLKRVNVHRGWKLVKQAFGKNLRNYQHKLEQVSKLLNYPSVDDLLNIVGSDELSIQRLRELIQDCTCPPETQPGFCTHPGDGTFAGIGEQNWRIASCCTPLPGDPIVGVAGSPKRLVRIHRADCSNIQDLDPQKVRSLNWNCDRCRINLQMTLTDQPDAFRPILNTLAENFITPDLRSLNISDGTARASIGITITSRQHLEDVLSQISSLPNVLKVKLAKPILIMPGSVLWADEAGVSF